MAANAVKVRHMIVEASQQARGAQEPLDRQLENLGRMVGYCENKADCRRVLLLAYLGDDFHRDQCVKTCDTCVAGGTYEAVDMTSTSLQVRSTRPDGSRFTLDRATSPRPPGASDA